MKLEEIMTTEVVTIGMDDKLKKVQEIFESRKFHHLLVVEEEELVGIVSDRDLLKQLSPFINTDSERFQDMSTLDKRVHQIMTRKPITAGKEDTVREAAELFIKKRISCLPILSPENEIIGLVTWKDILKKLILEKKDDVEGSGTGGRRFR
jgi:acetoin utilization protein AcuB